MSLSSSSSFGRSHTPILISAITLSDAPPDSFATLYRESLSRYEMKIGEVITAEVVSIEDKFVIVNAGLKSESYIPIEEFKSETGEITVQVGDFISVAIDALENGHGETLLSHHKAKILSAWHDLEVALETGRVVTGTIKEKVKGGLHVQINGIRAFLPGSLIDIRPVKDMSPYEGKVADFKVIKLDKKRNNIVVSRKAMLEITSVVEQGKLLESMTEGTIVKGTVKNITDYGAFIDLGGVDGLIHITDMSWRRVRHPSEIMKVGEEVSARVLRFDFERNRVSLGLKQMADDPWNGIARRYPKGTRMFGKVTNLVEYGVFVEIEKGIEGLVHVSEMEWGNRNAHPSKIVTSGQEVEVMILGIEEDRRRISLGMKQCKSNPWEDFATACKKGDRVKGLIRSITDFGVFIGLPGNIDGLIHLTDMSWVESSEEMIKTFKKGQEVEAVLLSVDVERERISLGIKQMADDPWSLYVNQNDKGALVKGVVKTIDPKGALITLSDQVTGFLRANEITKERTPDPTAQLKENQELNLMIISVDRKNRTISLSLKAKDQPPRTEGGMMASSDASNAASGTVNLGALLKKAKMDQDAQNE